MESKDVADHPIAFFCPQTLVEYRSQELMPFPENRNLLRVQDLKVEPDDKSRRLDQEPLEHHWAVKSQDTSLELPMGQRRLGVAADHVCKAVACYSLGVFGQLSVPIFQSDRGQHL